jgi:hypothetical protein
MQVTNDWLRPPGTVMTLRYLLVPALGFGLVNWLDGAEPKETEIRAAIGRALPLIQKGSTGHRTQRTCFACHHQAIPLLAMTTVRARGFAIDEEEVQKHLRFIADFLGKNRDNYLKGKGQGGQADMAGYALWTLEMGGWKADPTTAAVAEYLLQRDQDRDHWRTTSNRPPSEASPFTTTYVALRGLQSYGTKEQQKRIEERVSVVRKWLTRSPAKDTEDRIFRLWALQRAGGDTEVLEGAVKELIHTQRPDGGWAQLEALSSDAYATGSALVALQHAGGLNPQDAVYRRGVQFLVQSQHEDGSWYVHSRSKPFQTYFESGFPHGKDQFISLAASSWATTALALALTATEH